MKKLRIPTHEELLEKQTKITEAQLKFLMKLSRENLGIKSKDRRHYGKTNKS